MKKAEIKLENTNYTNIESIGFFKSIVNFLKELTVNNYINALAEAINNIGNLKTNITDGTKLWYLLNKPLLKTTIDLLLEKTSAYQEIQTFDIDIQFNKLLKENEYGINNDFFSSPHKNSFIIDAKTVIENFYQLFDELEKIEIKNIMNRFDDYFTYNLINEYRENYNEYSSLKDLLETPFLDRENKNIEWYNYNKWLKKQISENIFSESFSLNQIYIPLRGYYKELSRSKNYIYTIVDLEKEISSWIKEKDKNNAIKVIRGGPGFGKSSFLKLLANKLSIENHKVLFIPLHEINIDANIIQSISNYLEHSNLLKTNPFEEDELIIIFDGLDELQIQGKNISESAEAFTCEINRQVDTFNRLKCRLQVLISGRDIVIQENKSEFKKEKEIVRLLPYYLDKNQSIYFGIIKDDTNLLSIDQRNSWWAKYSKLKNKKFNKFPRELKRADLCEITSQPLLNYLISISYETGEINFNDEINLNDIYHDLLKGVYKRAHISSKNFNLENFILILEEIAFCTWKGNNRVTTIDNLKKHFTENNLEFILNDFISESKRGIFSLLTVFYFRIADKYTFANESFEFTHKSFSEYLTSRKLTNKIEIIYKEYYLNKKDRKSLEECLIEFINIFAHETIDDDLNKFIMNQLLLISQKEQNKLIKIQQMFEEFLLECIQNFLPIEKSKFNSCFKVSYNSNLICEKNLLIILSNLRRINNKVFNLNIEDKNSLGIWISRLIPQGGMKNDKYLNFLNHFDMKYCNLTRKDLYNSNLYRTNLSEANLSSTNLKKANLNQANLNQANLIQANLNQANLNQAKMIKSKLTGSNLSEANLSEANLSEANLREANLSEANLSEANLSKAKLEKSNLIQTNLEKASLLQAKLEKADLRNAKIERADLRNAKLERADLSEANLNRSYLEGANLKEADLSNCDLKNSKLKGAKLEKANLDGANLAGADLTNVKNLTYEQLTKVKSLYNSKGLDQSLLNKLIKSHLHLIRNH